MTEREAIARMSCVDWHIVIVIVIVIVSTMVVGVIFLENIQFKVFESVPYQHDSRGCGSVHLCFLL